MSKGELPSYADVLEREAADEYATDDGYDLVRRRAIDPWQYERVGVELELWGTVSEGDKKRQAYVLLNTFEREVGGGCIGASQASGQPVHTPSAQA